MANAAHALPRLGPESDASLCTRCGRRGRLYPFPAGLVPGRAELCGACRSEWDRLLPELVSRWHSGLRACFFCRRPLGSERFPARSPLGTSCTECGLVLAALLGDPAGA